MKIENKKVVAFTADVEKVTLYFANGDTQNLASNERFTKEVVDKITPALARGEQVLLNMEDRTLNIFVEVQRKSKGLLKFFRVAKKALLDIDEPTETHIQSISMPLEDYAEAEDETIVAVVQHEPEPELELGEKPEASQAQAESQGTAKDDVPARTSPAAPKQSSTVIAGAERLKGQIGHYNKAKSMNGFEAFMQRVAKVQNIRKHSANELLDFLEKADLPITDDGCILAYKKLTRRGDHFVDSHSRTVPQRLGSYVYMKAEMVDPNRRNECSNGLHVGRRSYMGSFNGDGVVLVKVAPEDVIAVPMDYSGSKMRCCAYHIVGIANVSSLRAINSNEPMTRDQKVAKFLTMLIEGNHVGITEKVHIVQHGKVEVTKTGIKVIDAEPETDVAPTEAIPDQTDLKVMGDAKDVAPEVIRETARKAKKAAAPKAPVKAPEPASKAVKGKAKGKGTKAKAPAPVAAPVVPEGMTPDQAEAKRLWPQLAAGTMTKVALAKVCGTSTRSLDRWAEKFKF